MDNTMDKFKIGDVVKVNYHSGTTFIEATGTITSNPSSEVYVVVFDNPLTQEETSYCPWVGWKQIDINQCYLSHVTENDFCFNLSEALR